MNDSTTTVKQIKDILFAFMQEREWQQFHTPKNLSTYVAIEAAELMEKFVWVTDKGEQQKVLENNRREVEDELADVIITALAFCNACDIDVARAVKNKMVLIAQRYPVEKAKGNALKYTQL